MEASASSDESRELRELCFGGDWACADGNLDTLVFVVHRIAASAPAPIQARLLVVAELCLANLEQAIAIWLQLKDGLLAHRRQLAS